MWLASVGSVQLFRPSHSLLSIVITMLILPEYYVGHNVIVLLLVSMYCILIAFHLGSVAPCDVISMWFFVILYSSCFTLHLGVARLVVYLELSVVFTSFIVMLSNLELATLTCLILIGFRVGFVAH